MVRRLMRDGHECVVYDARPLLAPKIESAPRTPGRDKADGTAEHGCLHCGRPRAGHFVKMVHNGIEDGLMAAYAKGLNLLKNKVELLACDSKRDEISPHERLIGDAMDGDETLFTREDSVDVAWQIVQPILKSTKPVQPYEPGTWGPEEARRRFAPPHGWTNPTT
jgi:glucose-6-phosphate dehydrogenase-like protein/6-phosphogluconate dehydrogenase-like protein